MTVSTITIPVIVKQLEVKEGKQPSTGLVAISADTSYPLVPITIWNKGIANSLQANTKVLLVGTPKIKQGVDPNFPAYERFLELDVDQVFDYNGEEIGVEKNVIVLNGKVKSLKVLTFANDKKLATIVLSVKATKKEERHSWFNCDVWYPLCNIVESYVQEGDMVGIKGSFEWRNYSKKDGTEKTVTGVLVRQLELLPKQTEEEF